MYFKKVFDVIVVGAGHAGVEAALISSKMKSKTLLITSNVNSIGQMSCNPSIGGIGKGHLVKEIDAMGGFMGIAADNSGIQFCTLNYSKGAAVCSTRCQIDRVLYKNFFKKKIEGFKNLFLLEQIVFDLIVKCDKVIGVITNLGFKIYSKTVILTTGTFLNSKVCIGEKFYYNNYSNVFISDRLKEFNLNLGRLKTGTPPRIDARSINFSILNKQYGSNPIPYFSIMNNENFPDQLNCWLTNTNFITHDIIYSNINKSSIYNGLISTSGPRYCPSIEEKVFKFKNKNSHRIYLEPDGLNSNEIYPNGISTSLPFDIQLKFLKSIRGLEKSYVIKPGYSIEYDYFKPDHLKLSLETKKISCLFFAGQINGTTGYEEAASQGLIAGINASLISRDKNPLILKRSNSYIGVLIDDLITKNIDEPYRIFTSRAEYRLSLMEINADYRLTKISRKLGCICDYQWFLFLRKYYNIKFLKNKLKNTYLNSILLKKLKKKINILDLLILNNFNYIKFLSSINYNKEKFLYVNFLNFNILNLIIIKIKYKIYIEKQLKEIKKQDFYENFFLPLNFDYMKIKSISLEFRHKLNNCKPETLGQVSRLLGFNRTILSILLVYFKFKGKNYV